MNSSTVFGFVVNAMLHFVKNTALGKDDNKTSQCLHILRELCIFLLHLLYTYYKYSCHTRKEMHV